MARVGRVPDLRLHVVATSAPAPFLHLACLTYHEDAPLLIDILRVVVNALLMPFLRLLSQLHQLPLFLS